MKETICRIIGIRGRTTIPFIFRRDLKITDDKFLRWERSGQGLIVTPLREIAVSKKVKTSAGIRIG